MPTRRQFLIHAPLLLGAGAACRVQRRETTTATTQQPGAPPTFGAAPPVGPEVSTATLTEAEKLVQVRLSDAQRAMAAASWRKSMAPYLERRVGPRKVALPAIIAAIMVRAFNHAYNKEGGEFSCAGLRGSLV